MVFLASFLSRFLATHGLLLLYCNFSAASVTPESIFSRFDTDSSGVIDAEEFATGIKNEGHDMSKKLMEAIFNSVDDDASGTVDLKEFPTLLEIAQRLAEVSQWDDLKEQLFHFYDTNDDNYVSSEELSALFSDSVPEEISALVKGDNMLDFNEFSQIMEAVERL
ncbi:troponin C, skeletal muscle-like [Synchiropus splendidus]|uniref:troponin C, skeletal muscle-like n=1 Tax=Synchiropus splendidus TaxID=270530 RepID=UPI00237E3DD0|nr:troponin C, skeletal muscle-like [Synchiropus splendidus]